MAQDDKDRPTPLVPDDPIRTVLARAAAGDVDENLTIALRVSGGMPSQAYNLEYRVGGDLGARVRLDDKRTGRSRVVDGRDIARDDVATLARKLIATGVLDVPVDPPRFLPDTIVGIIEISDGGNTFRAYFAADPDQASVQDAPPRPELHRAADIIYASAGDLIGEPALGP
jgi:hypothetical protein